jgi:hypothetical protein
MPSGSSAAYWPSRATRFQQTMALFGTLAYFWLREELSFRAPAKSPQRITRALAALGAWSYSP